MGKLINKSEIQLSILRDRQINEIFNERQSKLISKDKVLEIIELHNQFTHHELMYNETAIDRNNLLFKIIKQIEKL